MIDGAWWRLLCVLLFLLFPAAVWSVTEAGEARTDSDALRAPFARLAKSKYKYVFGESDGVAVPFVPREAALDQRDSDILAQAGALAWRGTPDATSAARRLLARMTDGAHWRARLLEGGLLLVSGRTNEADRAFLAAAIDDRRALSGLPGAVTGTNRPWPRIRSRVESGTNRTVRVLHDRAIAGDACRLAWSSFALAHALYRFEGLWRDVAPESDSYVETYAEHLFAWRVLARTWGEARRRDATLRDPELDRLLETETRGLLPGFVFFEVWRDATPEESRSACKNFWRDIRRYWEEILAPRPVLRPAAG